MQAQPVPSRLAAEPVTADCWIGESSHDLSARCSSCERGGMHRTHRESYFDFFLSTAGIYPTFCCCCKARGRRLYPGQLAIRLFAAFLAVGFIVLCFQRARPVVWDGDQSSSLVSLKPQANSKSLPSPPSNKYASPKTSDGDVSLNPQGPPLIK
jgi:hypothetical protein